MSTEETQGMKEKKSKTRFSLIEIDFLWHMAEVLTKPVRTGKHGAYSWKDIDSKQVAEDYYDSLMRHAGKARGGEYLDESGEPHWAAVAVNAMILWWHQRKERQ